MGQPPPVSESVNQLLRDLYSQPGVSGACLQVNGLVLTHDLPYSDDRIAVLAKRIDELIAGYTHAERSIWQICAGYEKYRLLILCRSALRLSILLERETDPALIAGRATRLLMDIEIPEPEPEPPTAQMLESVSADTIPRKELERLVTSLMSRVTGTMTAHKLFQRQMADRNGATAFAREDARSIGLEVLKSVPNRGKRESLTSEFLNAINL